MYVPTELSAPTYVRGSNKFSTAKTILFDELVKKSKLSHPDSSKQTGGSGYFQLLSVERPILFGVVERITLLCMISPYVDLVCGISPLVLRPVFIIAFGEMPIFGGFDRSGTMFHRRMVDFKHFVDHPCAGSKQSEVPFELTCVHLNYKLQEIQASGFIIFSFKARPSVLELFVGCYEAA